MAFKFNKKKAGAETKVVMALEMSDGDNKVVFKYRVPHLRDARIAALYCEARRMAKGVLGADQQGIVATNMSTEILESLEPVGDTPSIETVLEYMDDEQVQPFMTELVRLATVDRAILAKEGVEVQ